MLLFFRKDNLQPYFTSTPRQSRLVLSTAVWIHNWTKLPDPHQCKPWICMQNSSVPTTGLTAQVHCFSNTFFLTHTVLHYFLLPAALQQTGPQEQLCAVLVWCSCSRGKELSTCLPPLWLCTASNTEGQGKFRRMQGNTAIRRHSAADGQWLPAYSSSQKHGGTVQGWLQTQLLEFGSPSPLPHDHPGNNSRSCTGLKATITGLAFPDV